MSKFYIVWNEGRNEAFITDDEGDAKVAATGCTRPLISYSTAAMAFHEAYSQDVLKVETIDLDPSHD